MAEAQVISHWHHLVEGFQTSALDFYASVEQGLKARQVPDIALSRVVFKEGGVLSAKREYLRIQRGKVAFDICAAPFGTGYFFSWWLVRLGPAHPFLWLATFFIGFPLAAGILVNLMGRTCSAIVFVTLLMPLGVWLLGDAIRDGRLPIEEDVLALPILGWLYERLFNPLSYYRLDTALMFQDSVRSAVNEVIETLLTGEGRRALLPEELRPTIRDLGQ